MMQLRRGDIIKLKVNIKPCRFKKDASFIDFLKFVSYYVRMNMILGHIYKVRILMQRGEQYLTIYFSHFDLVNISRKCSPRNEMADQIMQMAGIYNFFQKPSSNIILCISAHMISDGG